MRANWLFVLAIILSHNLSGQVGIDDVIESQELINGDATNITERYEYYLNHRLNLNAKESELIDFPFWNHFQLDEILAYRKKLGGFVEISELKLLNLLSEEEYEFLEPLLSIKETQVVLDSDAVNGEVLTRVGFVDKPHDFLGKNYNCQTRLKLATDLIKIAFVLQKDKGEVLWDRKNGIDFFGASITYSIKEYDIVLGDYQLNVGQGLLVWQSFGGDKNFSMATANKVGKVFNAKSGVDEFRFYRGAVASKRWKHFRLLSFYSQRQLDATINEKGNVTRIRNSGLHRNSSERNGQSRLEQKSYGTHFSFQNKTLSLATTFIRDHYSKPLEIRTEFREGKPALTTQNNCSISWGITKHRWVQYGESAFDMQGDYAVVFGNTILVGEKTTVDLALRSLSANLAPVYANPFSEKEGVPEKGIYLSVKSQLFDFANITFYRDQYLFDGGLTNRPFVSEGIDYGLQLNSYLAGVGKFFFRVKYEQQNDVNEIHYLNELVRYRLQFQCSNSTVQWQSRLEFSQKEKLGWLYYLQVKTEQRNITTVLRATIFDVPTFKQAIYAYTPNLRYAYRNYAYHNRGIQYIAKIRSRLFSWLKPSLVAGYMMDFDQRANDFFELSLQLEAKL